MISGVSRSPEPPRETGISLTRPLANRYPCSAGGAQDPTRFHPLTLPEAGLGALFGVHDENLRLLEDAFGVEIAARGREVSISGNPEGTALAARLLSEFAKLIERGIRPEEARPRDGSPHRQGRPRGVAGRLLSRTARSAPRSARSSCAERPPAGVPAGHRRARHRLRDRPGRHRKDVPRGCDGRGGAPREARQADRPLPSAVEAGEKLGFLPGDLAER